MPEFRDGGLLAIGASTSSPPEAVSAVGSAELGRVRTISSLRGASATATRSYIGHNHRTAMYGAVREAISMMPRFSPGHPFFVEDGVASEAIMLLSMIEENLEVEAPQIFPQDDETLILKWVRGKIERLLSISEAELSILERVAGSRIKCLHEDEREDGFDLGAVFSHMGNVFSTSTQSGRDDA